MDVSVCSVFPFLRCQQPLTCGVRWLVDGQLLVTSLQERNGPVYLLSLEHFLYPSKFPAQSKSLGRRSSLTRTTSLTCKAESSLCPFLVSRQFSHTLLWPSFPKAISQHGVREGKWYVIWCVFWPNLQRKSRLWLTVQLDGISFYSS